MNKSILAFCFLFSLVFSILTPSVSNLLKLDHDEVALIDISEEESQNEVESSVDKDVMLIESLSKISNIFIEEYKREFKFYLENSSMHTSSVYIPPPEFRA